MTHPFKHNKLAAALLLTGASLVVNSALALPAIVSNGNNDGAGSLRAALESGAREIVVTSEEDIMITETLTYSGTRSLSIYGSEQNVMNLEDITLLEMSQGASLTVIGLNFRGPGGFDIENQSVDPENAGKGIFIDVRDQQSGTAKLDLKNVTVSGVANHGVHVSDCDLADDCGGGGAGGLRVDERDNGSIAFVAHGSTFTHVGADGAKLDEGQNGNVKSTITDSEFIENGAYCDPDILEPELEAFLDGVPDETEFDDGTTTEADIPGPVTGSSDDGCFEREVDFYDSGFVEAYEFGIDVDDGFDIDEAGNGEIKAQIIGSNIDDNLDEGADFDEEDNGGIRLISIDSGADENADDGYKLSEEGNSSVEATLHNFGGFDNGGKGIVLQEADNGSLNALVDQSETSGNDDGETDIEAVQENKGSGTLTVRDSDIDGDIETEGVTLIEE